MTLQIGLTGSIGAGKSTVAKLLREAGIDVIDADDAAGQALSEPEVQAALEEAFGPDVLDEGGVHRPALAAIVFGDDTARAKLESIVHPRVRALMQQRVAQLLEQRPAPEAIVHDVPLLYEAGRAEEMDAVLVVDAPLEERIERVLRRSGVTEQDVRQRDAAQWSAERKRREADVVIDNVGTLEDLENAVHEAWPRVLQAARVKRGTAN